MKFLDSNFLESVGKKFETNQRSCDSRNSIIFSVKTEKHLTAFESSFVGHICGKHKKEDDTTVRKDLRLTMKDNEFYEIEKETPPLKDSILRNDFEFYNDSAQTPTMRVLSN